MIGRVVLLADQSAHYAIAGLSQLDRSLRTLEECFGSLSPEVVVYWQRPDLVTEARSRLVVSHQVAGTPLPVRTGEATLVLRTSVVFRRKVLAGLLRSGEPRATFAVLSPDRFPAEWVALDSLFSDASSDAFAWVMRGPDDAPAIERELVRTTGKPTDGLVSRTLNRPISQRLSRLLLRTAVTPDQISLVVFAVLASSLWVLTWGTPQGFVLGMLLFHLASVLDGCDGEIARAKFLESQRGAWLDTSVDLLGNFLLPLGVAIGLTRQPGLSAGLGGDYLMEGILTSLGIAVGVFGVARARTPGRADFNDFGSSAVGRLGLPPAAAKLLALLVNLLRRDSYVLLFLVFAILGKPQWILHFLALGIAAHLPVVAWSWWKSTRLAAALKAPDRP